MLGLELLVQHLVIIIRQVRSRHRIQRLLVRPRAAGAAEAPAYPVLKQVIKRASRTAIWLSERV